MSYPRLLLPLALACACGAVRADPGDLDLRFSGDGVAFIDAGGLGEIVHAMVPDADNAVFATGALYEVDATGLQGKGGASGYDLSVVRLRGDGSLDIDWGAGGIAQIDFGGDDEYGRDLVRLADGSLIVAGSLEREAHSDFGVARFTLQGLPDDLFGEPVPPIGKGIAPRRGAIAFNVGPDENVNDEATAVAVQSDGSIVVAGIARDDDGAFQYRRFGIARLTAEGQLDDTFRGDGWFIVPALASGASEYVTAIARRRDGTLTPDDGFVVAGYSTPGGRAVLRRFLADGQPDPQFGVQGLVTVEAGIGGASGTGLYQIDDAVLDDQGRIVVVGRGNDRGFVFMRFTPNGAIDGSFGTNGRRHVKFSGESDYDFPQALTLQGDGKIVAAGEATSRATGAPRTDFASVRLLRNGAVDTGYGDGAGRSSYPLSVEEDSAWAVTVTSDGSLLLAGTADVGTPDNDMAFLRLQGDPTLFADGFED
jgi:uncharacterized delta-60 repeat protein